MNFRSYADLEHCIAQHLHAIPRDVDLVVGIPRSGLLAALPIALHLNLPITDVEGLIDGRILAAGRRLEHVNRDRIIENARKILIIDDSLNTGTEMLRVRERLRSEKFADRLLFMAVYIVDPRTIDDLLDIWFEICPLPRFFAWNMMHHSVLQTACVDIDGVLCVDPTEEQNDDGVRYIDFLNNARPLYLPTVPILALVTSRLEKYRPETEAWLAKHRVQYNQLIMWDLPSKAARLARGNHGLFKAQAFRELQHTEVFIESSAIQAYTIANEAKKPVLCVENQTLYLPSLKALVIGAAKKSPRVLKRRLLRMKHQFKTKLLALNRW